MMEFFENYPYVKWILVGFGVLAILSKYLNFDPIDKWINRIKRYKFEEITHLGDEKLKGLIELMKQEKWADITRALRGFNDSYKSFGLRTLGQYSDVKQIDAWMNQEPESDLPKIVKAYYLVSKGWEIRGRGKIDTVSKTSLHQFKEHLHLAKELLFDVKSNADFKLNVHGLLLKMYKAIDIEREVIHSTYQKVIRENENHAELNFNYFAAISPKWGGKKEEVDQYLATLENKSEFINYLITAQYYFDYVHMLDGKDENGQMKAFIEEMKNFQPALDELYKYELYLLLYWLSNNLEYEGLESYYKQLAAPFCQD